MSLASHAGVPTPEEQRILRGLIETNLPRCRPESAQHLASTARVRHVPRGERIFRQGDEVPLTLVVRGHGGFRRTTSEGQQLMTGIAYPGEIIGLTSISATISSVELIALTDTEVAAWRGEDFRRLAVLDPDLAFEVIDRMAILLHAVTEKLDGFLHQDARRRVVRVLERHRDLIFGDPSVISRTHLPGLVGTSREMTGRVLRELEREGTVARVGRTSLKLLDPERLNRGVRSGPVGT